LLQEENRFRRIIFCVYYKSSVVNSYYR